MPTKKLKRGQRSIANFFNDNPGFSFSSFHCRKQAKKEKIMIPYYIYNRFHKTHPDSSIDSIELAVKVINKLRLFTLIAADKFPEEFLWSYPDNFSPPYNGPRIHLRTDLGIVDLIKQVMYAMGLDDMMIGETIAPEDTHAIFERKTNITKTDRFENNQDDFAQDYIDEEEKPSYKSLIDYSLVSLFSIMHGPFRGLDTARLNDSKINELLQSYHFSEALKNDFLYLIKGKKLNGRVLSYQDIQALALLSYHYAPESLVGRTFHFPDSLFIPGQFVKAREKIALPNVISALKKAEKFEYPLLASNRTLVLHVSKPFTNDLIIALAIVSLSDSKIHCSFQRENFLDDFSIEKTATTTSATPTTHLSEFISEKINTSLPIASLQAELLSKIKLEKNCTLRGFVPNKIKVELPIFIKDSVHQLTRYITFHVISPPKENYIMLGRPNVSYMGSETTLNLQTLCAAVAIPKANLLCQLQNFPSHWYQQGCRVFRYDLEPVKFSINFSIANINKTCQFEFIPHPDLYAISKAEINTNTSFKNVTQFRPAISSITVPPSIAVTHTQTPRTSLHGNIQQDATSRLSPRVLPKTITHQRNKRDTKNTLPLAPFTQNLARSKRFSYIPWEIIYLSFDCRKQAKTEKMLIPYKYIGLAGDVISRHYTESMDLAVKNLNQLQLFELVATDRVSPDVFSSRQYTGPLIKIATENYMSQLTLGGHRFLLGNATCDICNRVGISTIGCRSESADFYRNGIAALIREIMHAIGLVDIIIGETVKIEETHHIFKHKLPPRFQTKNRKFRYHFNKQDRYDSYSETKRSAQLLANYSLASLFSIMHEPFRRSDHFNLNSSEISKRLQNYHFSKALKADFVYLLMDENINNRILNYQDIQALALLIYHYAPESLVGRRFNFPDYLLIQGQFIEARKKIALTNVINALKKAEKFEYPLLASNKTLVLHVSEAFTNDLITTLAIVSLSDSAIRCAFQQKIFSADSSIEENITVTSAPQTGNLSEFTPEKITTSMLITPIQMELLSEMKLEPNCRLSGSLQKKRKVKLPIFISDASHQLTRYITFQVISPTQEKYLLLGRPHVNYLGNDAVIDLQWLCAAAAVPEENLICWSETMPSPWQQEDCFLIRHSLDPLKFNITFSTALINKTCTIQLSPNASLPLVFPKADDITANRLLNKTIQRDRPQTTSPTLNTQLIDSLTHEQQPSAFNHVSMDDKEQSHYQQAPYRIEEKPASYSSLENAQTSQAKKPGKNRWITLVWGAGVTTLATLLLSVGYTWIRRFRNSRSSAAITSDVATPLTLLKNVAETQAKEKANTKIQTIQTLNSLQNDEATLGSNHHLLFTTKKWINPLEISRKKFSKLTNKRFILGKTASKTKEMFPANNAVIIQQARKLDLTQLNIKSDETVFAVKYLLYLFGRKTVVERMNRIEKQEIHTFFSTTNDCANELTYIAKQLDSAIKHYR